MLTQFRLIKEEQRHYKYDDRYWFDTLTKDRYRNRSFHIQKLISDIKTELSWDDAPDMDTFKKRLEFGSCCHLWMFETQCLGWHWTHDKHITKDWFSSYRLLEDNEIYSGGAFLSKDKPEASSASKFYNQGIRYGFDYHKKDIQYLYNDDWNRASSILSRQVGFTEYKFL